MSPWSSFIPGRASPAPPASAIMLVAPCHPTGSPQNMLKWQQLASFLVWLAGNSKDDWGYEGFKQTYLILTPDGTNVLHQRFSPNYIHCFNHLIIYSANDKHASGLMKDGKFTEGFPAMCFFHRKCVPATTILSCQCTLATLALCVPEVQLALWQRQCARRLCHSVVVPPACWPTQRNNLQRQKAAGSRDGACQVPFCSWVAAWGLWRRAKLHPQLPWDSLMNGSLLPWLGSKGD